MKLINKHPKNYNRIGNRIEGMTGVPEVTYEPDVVEAAKSEVERQLDNLKKIEDAVSQMRVQAACVQAELMLMVDVDTWRDVARLIGLSDILERDI